MSKRIRTALKNVNRACLEHNKKKSYLSENCLKNPIKPGLCKTFWIINQWV